MQHEPSSFFLPLLLLYLLVSFPCLFLCLLCDEVGRGTDKKDEEKKKGRKLTNSLPMTWQATAAFLACARIGAVHSAVFAGFSAESLRDRVKDCDCKVVITTEYVFFFFFFSP